MRRTVLCSSIGLTLSFLLLLSNNLRGQNINSAQHAHFPFTNVPAEELIQSLLLQHRPSVSMYWDELFRRFDSGTSMEQSDLITACLKVITDTSQPDRQRYRVMHYLTYSHNPTVMTVETLIAIATNKEETLSIKEIAIKSLAGFAAVHQNNHVLTRKVHSTLVEILADPAYEELYQTYPFLATTTRHIGLCGPIATDTLLELWNNKSDTLFDIAIIHGLGNTGDVRALDFLLDLVAKTDLKSPVFDSHGRIALVALGSIGRYFLGTRPKKAPRSPDPISLARVRSTLEKAMQPDNHPLVLGAASLSFAKTSRRGDFASISRLESVLPHLEPSHQKLIESFIKKLEPRELIVTPPADVSIDRSCSFAAHGVSVELSSVLILQRRLFLKVVGILALAIPAMGTVMTGYGRWVNSRHAAGGAYLQRGGDVYRHPHRHGV